MQGFGVLEIYSIQATQFPKGKDTVSIYQIARYITGHLQERNKNIEKHTAPHPHPLAQDILPCAALLI